MGLIFMSSRIAVVSGGGGALVHGDSKTLSGFGAIFGTKSPAAPLYYHDCASGTIGAKAGAPWSYDDSLVPSQYQHKYKADQAFGVHGKSIYSGHGDKISTDIDNGFDNIMMMAGLDWTEVYYSFRQRINVISTGGGSIQLKLDRLLGPVAYSSGPQISAIRYFNGDQSYIDMRGMNNSAQYNGPSPTTDGTAWNRIETYAKIGTLNTADGARWRSVNDDDDFHNGAVQFAGIAHSNSYSGRTAGVITRGNADGDLDANSFQRFMLSFYLDSPGHGGDIDQWHGEFYFDVTRKRIEIGDSQNYYSCARRSPQPATSWSSSSVDITLNQGDMLGGSVAYGFAVADDGLITELGSIGSWA